MDARFQIVQPFEKITIPMRPPRKGRHAASTHHERPSTLPAFHFLSSGADCWSTKAPSQENLSLWDVSSGFQGRSALPTLNETMATPFKTSAARHRHPANAFLFGSLLALFSAWPGFGEEKASGGRVLGALEPFSDVPTGPLGKGFIDHWNWSDRVREEARQASRIETVATGSGKQLQVRISSGFPDQPAFHRLISFTPHFPPEADAVRMRIKVTAGTWRLFLGGPTAYYANSDVFTAVHEIKAASPAEWVSVEFSLNHPLWRNFRRAGFSTEAPRNYYTRWSQEPTALYVAGGSSGECLLDQVELIAHGEGRAFPHFEPDQVKRAGPIADFEDGQTDRVFTLYGADNESEWFEQSWKREKPLRFTPAQLSLVDTGFTGRQSLACVGPSAEEVHCTGIRTEGGANANALRMTLRKDAPGLKNTLFGTGPAEALDVLVFVAPRGRPFPWETLAPAASLRESPHRGFDYQFSYREIRNRQDLHVAIYQTRRFLKPAEWTTLTLPLADFTCVYGSGECRDRFLKHQPLASDDIIAVAWLNPWSRQGDRQSAVTLLVDDLEFATVPGTPEELRSYWQIPDGESIRLIPEGQGPQRFLYMLLPGEEAGKPIGSSAP